MKVCPECGHDQFKQRCIAVVEASLQVSDEGYVRDGYEEVMDVERDSDAITCADCCTSLDIDDLISEDEYNDETELST